MGSLFGSTTNPTPSTPTIGWDSQKNFFTALGGATLTPQPGNPDPHAFQFASMPAYPGRLTPDLSNMMSSNVWNSWSPNGPGMGDTTAMQRNITDQLGWTSPYVQTIQDGGAGGGNAALNKFAGGGPPSALAPFLTGGGNLLAGYLRSPTQVSAPIGVRPGMAQLMMTTRQGGK